MAIQLPTVENLGLDTTTTMSTLLSSAGRQADRSHGSRLQYYSIGEQILLSMSNMIASIVVVKAADVSWFGVYSFIFSLTVFASAFFASLLHGQMMLEISAKPENEKKSIFLATVAMQTFFLCSLMVVLWLLMYQFSDSSVVREYKAEIYASAIFVFVFNYYELFKQYLYVVDDQPYSFRCTVIYISVLFVSLLLIYIYADPDDVTVWVYRAFSLALLCGLLMNFNCISALVAARWQGVRHAVTVFQIYFSHGRFSLVSMTITLIQNHSMTPVLMWIGGPLVVGYFNLARLMVMPMAVISTGLTKSSTPSLRRAFKREGSKSLDRLIFGLNKKNMMFSALYLLFLAVLHYSGLFERFVPSYSEVVVYLLIWIAISLVTMYRAWKSQFFIISMQFKFLLRVSVVALIVTFAGVLGVGLGLKNIQMALFFIVVGELTSIYLFRQEQSRSAI